MKTKNLIRLALTTFLFAVPLTGVGDCNKTSIRGLYGLATQGIDSAGVHSTTLSLFEFKADKTVEEIYYVNTPSASWKSTASGSYSVSTACEFSLKVKDTRGAFYALAGRLNPKTRQLSVIQTLPNSEEVATGVMYPVGLKHCGARRFIGRYAFLSQGVVPEDEGSPARVPESRVGWFVADQTALNQPVELVNFNGSLSESLPTQIPSTTLESCLVDIDNGGFAGVVVERGYRVLYMDLAPGSTRLGLMTKVR